MLDSTYQAGTDMALDDHSQRALALPVPVEWHERFDWSQSMILGAGVLLAVLLAIGIAWAWRKRRISDDTWWWPYAAKAGFLTVGVAVLEEGARQSYLVLQLLAGGALSALLLGGLWLIGRAADREGSRRRERT